MIVTERLLGLGIEVVEAADGFEAFNRLRHEPFDVAVMDLQMPGLDGYELLGCVRGHPKLSRLPVVIVSGAWDLHSKERALSGGATRFLTKPIDTATFSNVICSIVGFKAAMLEYS